MNESWATLWEGIADAIPQHPMLVQGERSLTWAEFDSRAARLAAALSDMGAGPGSKVAILAHNCPEYLEVVYAAYKLRGSPVNLNFRYREDELVEVLDDSDSEVLVFQGTFAELAGAAARRASRVKALIQIDDGSPLLDGAMPYETAISAAAPLPRIERSGDDVFLLYTGGTTGRPRGVMWRHRDLIATIAAVVYVQAGLPIPADAAGVARLAAGLNARGVNPSLIPASPLMHGTALYLTQALWLMGGTAVLLEGRGFDAHEFWRAVERHRISTAAIVGDVFARRMVAALDEASGEGRPYDISGLQSILNSGAAWTTPVKQALLDRGSMALVDQVGSTEGGPTLTQLMPPRSRVADCRWALGARARLLDAEGSIVDPASGEIGELGFSPPHPLGYYKDPAKSATIFRTGGDGQTYCVPGDYAVLGPDGDVVLLGRGSLCVNTGGEKVYVEEVEGVILEHPAVVDANVVGLPDEEWGSALVAVVALRDGAAATEADVQAAVRARLAGYKVPRRVVFVDAIERSPSGKARYAWAREVAVQGVEAVP